MLSTNFKSLIAPQARILNFIWLAFTASTLVYVFVAYVAFGMGSSQILETPLEQHLGPISFNQVGIGLMVMLGFAGTYYQKMALRNDVLKNKVPGERVWPPAGSQTNLKANPADRGMFEGLSDTEKDLAGLWPYYQTTMIVVAAFLEAIAVLGMILAFLGGDFRVTIPATAASMIMLILKRPRPGIFFANVRL